MAKVTSRNQNSNVTGTRNCPALHLFIAATRDLTFLPKLLTLKWGNVHFSAPWREFLQGMEEKSNPKPAGTAQGEGGQDLHGREPGAIYLPFSVGTFGSFSDGKYQKHLLDSPPLPLPNLPLQRWHPGARAPGCPCPWCPGRAPPASPSSAASGTPRSWGSASSGTAPPPCPSFFSL